MTRNELLAATRELFLREFNSCMRTNIDNCAALLFVRAEKAKSGVEERRFFTAREDLTKRATNLHAAFGKSLGKLLHRSFQTAYTNTASVKNQVPTVKAGGLSLVETKTIDSEMRLDAIIKRFRDEAGDELRDLNIRMALLFLQETINERENPFRPYVLVQSLTDTLKSFEFSEESTEILDNELTELLRGRVHDIYATINELLAKNGIGTELKLRVQKQSDGVRAKGDGGTEPAPPVPPESAPIRKAPGPAGQTSATPATHAAPTSPEEASQTRLNQFIQWIRNPDQPPGGALQGPASPAHGGIPVQETGQFTTSSNADGTFGGIAPADAPQYSPSAPSDGGSAPVSRSWMSGVQAVGGAIRRLFSVGRNLVTSDTPAPDIDAGMQGDEYSAPLLTPTVMTISPRLAQSVQDLAVQHVPDASAMIGADHSIRNLIMEQREQLAKLTDEASEQMTIDVVAMLFEFILRDAEVPPETRAQLGRLQYLVLKVALRDSEFLTHKSHPARMLVNRIGALAISLRQVDPNGAKLNEKVCDIVERLLKDTSEEVAIFASAVDELDQFVTTQLRSSRESVELAAQAIERVESRTLKFARITSVIADALSALPVDENLRQLLVVTWASVIEQAERIDPTTAGRYRELVPALVWSVAPKIDNAERKNLVRLLPNILRTLRDGLGLLGWTSEQQDKELAWLVDTHTRALRATHAEGKVPSLGLVTELFNPLLKMREAQEAINATPSSNLEPAMVADIGRELGVDLQVVDHLLAEDPSIPAPEPKITPTMSREEQAVIARLRAGVGVEMKLVGAPRPGRLTWVSATTKSMVFTYDEKQDTFILSARMFLRLLSSGHARFLESEPLFERALTSLLETADKMDRAPAAA